MMESTGIVKSTDGLIARVLVEINGGCCEHCEKETCDISEKGVETEALNTVSARVGQKVKVVMKPHTYFKGALILFIIPVFALITGALLGKIYLPAHYSGVDADLLSAIGGFLAFFTSLLFVKILSGRMNKKNEYKPIIESIMEEQYDRSQP